MRDLQTQQWTERNTFSTEAITLQMHRFFHIHRELGKHTLLIHHKQTFKLLTFPTKAADTPCYSGQGIKTFHWEQSLCEARLDGALCTLVRWKLFLPMVGVEAGNLYGPFWPKSFHDSMTSTLINRILICGKMNESLNLNRQNNK